MVGLWKPGKKASEEAKASKMTQQATKASADDRNQEQFVDEISVKSNLKEEIERLHGNLKATIDEKKKAQNNCDLLQKYNDHLSSLYDHQQNENRRLCGIIEEDAARILSLEEEIERLNSNLSATNDEKKMAQSQYHSLQKSNNDLSLQRDHQRKENSRLYGIIAGNDERILGLEKEQERLHNVIETLRVDHQREQQKLKGDIEFERTDNERLRTSIFKNESDLSALQSEDYYIQLFEELKGDVEGWIASHAKRTSTRTLPASTEAAVLDILMRLGGAGESSANFLIKNRLLQKEYYDVRSRIILIRHIVALFLFDQIFNPLAPGLPALLTYALGWMERDMIAQEQQFRKIIRTRQALCRAAKRYVDASNPDYQTKFTATLENLFSTLLPVSHESEIQKGVAKFVNKAITLKFAMMEETAVYRCHWVDCGTQFDRNSSEAEGEERGLVLFCTSPGLMRLSDGGAGTICAVKAGVVLKRLEER